MNTGRHFRANRSLDECYGAFKGAVALITRRFRSADRAPLCQSPSTGLGNSIRIEIVPIQAAGTIGLHVRCLRGLLLIVDVLRPVTAIEKRECIANQLDATH